MPLGYSMETDSSSEYRDGGGQVPSPVDSDLYQRNQQETLLNLETSLQHTMFSSGGLWPVAAISPSSYDVSSSHDEQQPVAVWEESARKAKADIPSRQKNILNQDLDAIHFPYGNLPFDFMATTSVSRRGGGRVSDRRKRQNRDSQRAFRARQRTLVQSLEERLADLTQQYRELELAYLHLNTETQSLLEKIEAKKEVVDSSVPL
ncbi:uncharacterized protein K444DRAFT_666827 [Hyaloscypha bicolor E]|uniref:BZIP domain-containing protein n=1 Tax=Hyaloscypha bicolor E TaxID=1095630 RepID=A0A2J6SVQ5_9HELO|nr:uncharacterized protein K444DRAFT_666827 [Hyaloscypha bicolor E]PMD54862.1 hypothetical protein K444DRAFT_666827 [Hyaloscypha bicolor E]